MFLFYSITKSLLNRYLINFKPVTSIKGSLYFKNYKEVSPGVCVREHICVMLLVRVDMCVCAVC